MKTHLPRPKGQGQDKGLKPPTDGPDKPGPTDSKGLKPDHSQRTGRRTGQQAGGRQDSSEAWPRRHSLIQPNCTAVELQKAEVTRSKQQLHLNQKYCLGPRNKPTQGEIFNPSMNSKGL